MSDETLTLTCVNHPNVETFLRCNRCEDPICPKCAVLTPTGYRCKTCIRGQQQTFDTATWYDYPLTIAVAGLLGFVGSLIVPRIGFFSLFLAPVAGIIITEIIRRILRRRRSMRLYKLIATAAVIGSLPLLLVQVFSLLGGMSIYSILTLAYQGFYTFTIATTLYYRLGGIQIR